jgi:hypothetical protein
MTDTELTALAILIQAEITGMKTENDFRLRNGYAQAYADAQFFDTDEIRILKAELQRRKVIP